MLSAVTNSECKPDSQWQKGILLPTELFHILELENKIKQKKKVKTSTMHKIF